MSQRQLLLISSSKVHGFGFLEVATEGINNLLKKNNVSTILFIPYALLDYDGYLSTVANVFKKWGFAVEGIHNLENPVEAVQKAQAIFIGGGNTFKLLKTLYDNNIIEVIRKRVLEHGVPYIGTSAGTNVATINIKTTNDMPIVYPPSFNALGLVPFNINPHYQDPDCNSTHQGETREQRILQYLLMPESGPVLGLREGNSLLVEGNKAILKGITSARLFMPKKDAVEVEAESDLSYLLNK